MRRKIQAFAHDCASDNKRAGSPPAISTNAESWKGFSNPGVAFQLTS